jgi:hypothetical protein
VKVNVVGFETVPILEAFKASQLHLSSSSNYCVVGELLAILRSRGQRAGGIQEARHDAKGTTCFH